MLHNVCSRLWGLNGGTKLCSGRWNVLRVSVAAGLDKGRCLCSRSALSERQRWAIRGGCSVGARARVTARQRTVWRGRLCRSRVPAPGSTAAFSGEGNGDVWRGRAGFDRAVLGRNPLTSLESKRTIRARMERQVPSCSKTVVFFPPIHFITEGKTFCLYISGQIQDANTARTHSAPLGLSLCAVAVEMKQWITNSREPTEIWSFLVNYVAYKRRNAKNDNLLKEVKKICWRIQVSNGSIMK